MGLQSSFRKRWLGRHNAGGPHTHAGGLSVMPSTPVRPKPPSYQAKHDTPRSPHKEHGPKGRQGAGAAVHAGRFQPVSVEDGAQALQQAYRDNPRAWNLTPHSAEDLKGSRVFLSHGGKAGFVISPDGELQNLFNNSGTKGLGAAGVKRAIAEGARTLNAYDGFLTPFYEKLGFRETERMEFDPKYAPDNLPKEIMAQRPDVVTMEYQPPTQKKAMLSRLVRKLEHRQLSRSLDAVLYKLEGEMMWEVTKSVTCKGYDRNGQLVIECGS